MKITRTIKANGEPIAATVFLIVFFVIGLSIYRDYGLSWDEPIQRTIGAININYIIGKDQELLSIKDRFYGPTFEILLIGLEKLAAPATLRDVLFLRHLASFITFFMGTAAFYALARNVFHRRWTAFFCMAALVLSPRIFDNAFYNSKDIPLLVFFTVSFLLLVRYIDTRRVILLILLAFFSAVTVTIRIAGILIPCLVAAAVLFGQFSAPLEPKKKAAAIAWQLTLYLGLFVLLVVLFWPVLWTNPLGNFIQAIREMSRFQWPGQVLFMGQWYPGADLPPYYAIVWILISSPVFYSLLFWVGIVFWAASLWRRGAGRMEPETVKWLFIAAWFAAPLFLAIALKSVLYDSWRHLFFIYPAFLLIGFWGLEQLAGWLENRPRAGRWLQRTAYLGLLLSFASTAGFMMRAHPYEQIYFNGLARSIFGDMEKQFDLDYWGLSYRRGLEYISRADASPVIYYAPEDTPGTYTFSLPEQDEKRLLPTTDKSQASYLVTTYRNSKTVPSYPEVYAIQVDGIKILSVFQLK